MLARQLAAPPSDLLGHRLQMIRRGEAGYALAGFQIVVAVFEPQDLDLVRTGRSQRLLRGCRRCRACPGRSGQGSSTPARCFVRNCSGLPGGWNGYPRHSSPATSPAARSWSATMLATRPPIDLPPMMRRPDAPRPATADRYSAISVSARGGGLRPASVRRLAI